MITRYPQTGSTTVVEGNDFPVWGYLVIIAVFVGMTGFILVMIRRERKGKPMFSAFEYEEKGGMGPPVRAEQLESVMPQPQEIEMGVRGGTPKSPNGGNGGSRVGTPGGRRGGTPGARGGTPGARGGTAGKRGSTPTGGNGSHRV